MNEIVILMLYECQESMVNLSEKWLMREQQRKLLPFVAVATAAVAVAFESNSELLTKDVLWCDVVAWRVSKMLPSL